MSLSCDNIYYKSKQDEIGCEISWLFLTIFYKSTLDMTQYHGSTKHFILVHSGYALAGDFESRGKKLPGYTTPFMVFSAHLVSHVLECHLLCFEVYAKLVY